jgi:hypothetical protein
MGRMSLPPPRRAVAFIVAGFLLTALFFSGTFPPFFNPNEMSRWQLVVAFVETGRFEITETVARLGDHEDKAISEGRVYSNKAPGLSFAAVPAYHALRLILPPPRPGTFDPLFRLVRFLTVTAAVAAALWRFGLRGAATPAGALPVFALAFGTNLLFYGRSFFAHAWTAALLFLSLELIRVSEEGEARGRELGILAAAGFLAGWSAISEYPTAILAALLFLRAAWRRPIRRAAAFAAGAAVPLGLLLAYNAAAFSSPWVLSTSREADPAYAALAARGIFGVGLPDPGALWGYFLHPARGLLIFSPFWIWAAVGFWRWGRSRRERPDFLLCLSATVLFLLVMSGYPNWHGGWSLSNRYLLPILFFAGLALPHALESRRSRIAFAAAAGFSAAAHFLLTAAWPQFPLDVPYPAAAGSLWFLARGWVADNLLSGLGVGGLLIPLLATAAAGAAALSASGEGRALGGGAVAGALLFAATLAVAPEPPYSGKLWRAAVYSDYSGRDPSRRELAALIAAAATPVERRMAQRAAAMYGLPPPP